MPATEQLHVFLDPSERAAISDAARRQHLSVSAYARNKLLAPALTENDEILLEGFAALKPRVEAIHKTVKANLVAIEKMRKKSRTERQYLPSSELCEEELANIADYLCLENNGDGLKK